jgi:hypothetical protein
MSPSPQPGAWTQQDGQIVARRRRDMTGDPHARSQWYRRVEPRDADLVGYPVRAAWREATLIHRNPADGTVRRLHDVGLVLISEWGFLQTCRYPQRSERDTDE